VLDVRGRAGGGGGGGVGSEGGKGRLHHGRYRPWPKTKSGGGGKKRAEGSRRGGEGRGAGGRLGGRVGEGGWGERG
jgi:hypothetical protein